MEKQQPLAAGKGVAKLVHDQAEDVGQRDQPRVRDGAGEESFGTARGSVAARHSGPTACTRDLLPHR